MNRKILLLLFTLIPITVFSQASQVRMYIENGPSMLGYIENVDSDFRKDMYELANQLKQTYGNCAASFISNTTTRPVDVGIFLQPQFQSEFKRGGSSNGSQFDVMFNTVLSKTNAEDISVFISDFVLSPPKGTGFNQVQALIAARIQEQVKLQAGFSVLIVQMKSGFNGKYYFESPAAKAKYGASKPYDSIRPYHVWIMGPQKELQKIIDQQMVSKHKNGFMQQFVYTNPVEARKQNSKVYWTVLKTTSIKGYMKPSSTLTSTDFVRGMEKVAPDKKGEFAFCVAVDLSKITASKAYLLDVKNYKAQGYTIVKIESFSKSKLGPLDVRLVANNKPTHLITFSTNKKVISPLSVSLLCKPAAWADAVSTMDDSNMGGMQTYGYQYPINALEQVYGYDGVNSLFSLNVPIIPD